MNRFSSKAGLALAVVVVVGLAGPAAAGEQVPFQGSYEGSFTSTRIPDTLNTLVVTEGTGTAVNLSGRPVYAKTGTAEVADGNKTTTNAWMIGYRGDLAFAVLVEGGSSGAHDAAPLVNSLLSNLPPSAYQ